MIGELGAGAIGAPAVSSEEQPVANSALTPTGAAVALNPAQTYDVIFSLHPAPQEAPEASRCDAGRWGRHVPGARSVWPEATAAHPVRCTIERDEPWYGVHQSKTDRLSGVRIVGISGLGQKTFLQFQVILKNQRQEELIDLQTVSAVLPSGRGLTKVDELLLERQPLTQQIVKAVRCETVRAIMREPAGARNERTV